MLACAAPAKSGEATTAFEWKEAYAGVFAGAGWAINRIVDVDGFANWGEPGWAVSYNRFGFVGGALMGQRFEIGGLPLRVEIDGTLGGRTASSNRVDPDGLDETVKSSFQWIVAARGGIEHSVGPTTLFALGGLAVARIDDSVTDIDTRTDTATQVTTTGPDPDDSFRRRATKIGWTVGLGVEARLADRWTLRLEGSYMDFGRSIRHVNRSGDNRCAPDKPQRPCPYRIRNRLGLLRLAIVHRFDP